MFKQSKKSVNLGSTDTLIGKGTFVEGTIRSEAGVRIEGKLQGSIESAGDIVIGETGEVNSHILARNVSVVGVVHGDVNVTEKCTIASSGQLFGNCTAQTLVIEEGARFEGTSSMQPSQRQVEQQANKESAAATATKEKKH